MAVYQVLVVDDNHEVRRMITACLRTISDEIEVLDVPSAEEALVVSASQPLDLVVIDFRLPGMSGLEMVGRLRKRKPGIKIILVTGVEDETARQQISAAGADAYFYKPIEITAFLEAVKRSLGAAPSITATPSKSKEIPTTPATNVAVKGDPSKVEINKETSPGAPQPSIRERLLELKRQLKAVAALLVNDTGQVLEEAGSAVDISTGSALLSALMHTFRASLQVSQAMAKGNSECLQYFAAPRQCIYVAPVGMTHALFVVTAGYFGPDKLGMIYHSIHLAVHDLQIILENEAALQGEPDKIRVELPSEVTIDPETLAAVEGIFSKGSLPGGGQDADGFWDDAGENGVQHSSRSKDALSYDQARRLGLAPDEGKSA